MISKKKLEDKMWEKYPIRVLDKLSAGRVMSGIINIIKTMPDEDAWINVADQLPAKDTELLLLKFRKEEYNARFDADYTEDIIVTGYLKGHGDNLKCTICPYSDGLIKLIPYQWKYINL